MKRCSSTSKPPSPAIGSLGDEPFQIPTLLTEVQVEEIRRTVTSLLDAERLKISGT